MPDTRTPPTQPRRRSPLPLPGWKGVLAVILLTGALILVLRGAGFDQSLFWPIGIALGVVLAGIGAMVLHARRRFRPMVMAARMLAHGHPQEALRELRTFRQRLDEDPGLARWQGIALGRGRLPATVLCDFHIGVCLYQGGELAEALEAFDRAGRAVPTFAEAWYNAAIAAATLGKRQLALDHLARGAPHAPDALRERAKAAPELESVRDTKPYREFTAGQYAG